MELATKSFTSKNADEEMVNRLFEDVFNKRMGGVTELTYYMLKWTDKEVVAVSKVIATGVLKKLELLDLSENQFSDAGVMALAEAARKARCRSSRNSTSATTAPSPSKPRTPSRPPCPTVMCTSEADLDFWVDNK